jgi:glycosyltransferase involved in cell wall biosynthesis
MSADLRVLMISRSDAYRASGGDTIQMEKTCAALKKLGVEATICLVDQLDGLRWKFDLVHLFNIQTADESWRAMQKIQTHATHGLPVLLSPIYWDPLEEWFWKASRWIPLWRSVRRLAGYRYGFKVYAAWQRLRYPRSPLWQLQRRILLAAGGLLPNSRAESDRVIRDFRLRPGEAGRVTIVPNAIDRELFDPLPSPTERARALVPDREFILTVGRVSPEKNSLGLIEALSGNGIPLVFVGRPSGHYPDYVEQCRQAAREHGQVHFVEWIDHDQLPELYALAELHILPSWRETPGLASLEAAAAGCRVVSTTIGSAREYFGAEAGYCHPADQRSIREAVAASLQGPRPENLRRRVLDQYNWDAAAAATFSAYQAAL